MKRSRAVASPFYMMISMAFLTGTYIFDYEKHPGTKHSLWLLFNIFLGATLGAYCYNNEFKMIFDLFYLLANAMSFNAATAFYSKEPNQAIHVSLLISGMCGIFYGIGILRFFRWGLALNEK